MYISPDCFIHNYVLLLGVLKLSKLMYKICSRHDIADILLKLALNTKQSINDSKWNFKVTAVIYISRIIFISSLKFKTKRLESLNKIEYGYPCLSDMRWTFNLVRITLFRNCLINKYIKYSMSVIKTLTSERIIR